MFLNQIFVTKPGYSTQTFLPSRLLDLISSYKKVQGKYILDIQYIIVVFTYVILRSEKCPMIQKKEMILWKNTILATQGALAHHLQNQKWPGGPKMADGVLKEVRL